MHQIQEQQPGATRKKDCSGFITSIKTIKAYNITVLDLAGSERLKGKLIVQQLENRKNYKFTHNSNNKKLVNYIVQELKNINI